MRIFFAVAVILLGSGGSVLGAGCDGILELASTGPSEIREVHLAEALLQTQCAGTALPEGWQTTPGLESVLERVPRALRLAEGSTRQKADHLCLHYGEWAAANRPLVELSRRLPDTAAFQWTQCKALEQKGLLYSLSADRNLVAIGVRRGINDALFMGVSTGSGAITCRGPFGEGGAQVAITDETRFSLTRGDSYAFSCHREPMADPQTGALYYPATTFSVLTQGFDPLVVTLPQQPVNADESGEVIERLGALEEQILKLQQRALKCSVSSVQTEVKGLSGHQLRATATVPPRYVADYSVTGGGCRIIKHDGNWSYIGNGAITEDRLGWFCSTEHVPNFGSTRALQADVIFCSVGSP